jgi:BlaI family penicillinase repressor
MTQNRLPEAEQDVLGVLYELGDATAREIRERLEPRRPLAHASVVTLLNRLEEKRLVRRRPSQRGKAFLFSPTRERTRTFGPLLSRLANRVFHGDHVALVASLFESHPPDAKEIAELEHLLDDWRARNRKEGSQ